MFPNLKMIIITSIVVTQIAFFTACNSGINTGSKINNVKVNDTTAALQVLLDSAFYKDRLGIAVQPNSGKFLKYSIIFERNDILIRYLPKNLSYKLFTEDEMCNFMTIHKLEGLQFLELDEFKKTFNGYQTALGAHCMWKGIEQTEPDEISHSICEREKYCNAVLNMEITKKGNYLTGSKFNILTY